MLLPCVVLAAAALIVAVQAATEERYVGRVKSSALETWRVHCCVVQGQTCLFVILQGWMFIGAALQPSRTNSTSATDADVQSSDEYRARTRCQEGSKVRTKVCGQPGEVLGPSPSHHFRQTTGVTYAARQKADDDITFSDEEDG